MNLLMLPKISEATRYLQFPCTDEQHARERCAEVIRVNELLPEQVTYFQLTPDFGLWVVQVDVWMPSELPI